MSDSLYNTLLASQGPSQSKAKRLMLLHTPVGRDVLLAERTHCEESVGPGNFLTFDDTPVQSRAAGVHNACACVRRCQTECRVGKLLLCAEKK